MNTPRGKCTHRTSGRMRIAIAEAKGDKELLAHVQEELSRCPQVSSATTNPLTGTVLIKHKGDQHQVEHFAEKHGLFTLGGDETPHGLEDMALKAYQRTDAAIRSFSGGEMDLRRAAFAAVVGTGAYQLLRGRFQAPPWHTAVWYAFNLFLMGQKAKGGKRTKAMTSRGYLHDEET